MAKEISVEILQSSFRQEIALIQLQYGYSKKSRLVT